MRPGAQIIHSARGRDVGEIPAPGDGEGDEGNLADDDELDEGPAQDDGNLGGETVG